MLYPTTCVGLRYGPYMSYKIAGFLGSMITSAITSPEGPVYYPVSASRVYLTARNLPTRFNVLFRLHAGVSLLRRRFSSYKGAGILTGWPSSRSSRMQVRARLTLIRLALIRNPWSFGGRVSRPPYRYLYLHLLFRSLQPVSQQTFYVYGMLPYQYVSSDIFHSFGKSLTPVYYPCRVA